MAGLLERLERKIEQVETDRWGDKQAPRIRLAEAAEDAATGLSGRLEIVLRRRDGSEFVCHERSLAGVRTEVAVDDCLAEALSIVLSRHTTWPTVAGGDA